MMLRFVEHKIFRILGYSIFFTVLFIAFLVKGFPAERFKSTVEQQIVGFLDRDVKIGEMGISFFGDVVLSNVEIEVSEDEDGIAPESENKDESKDATGAKSPLKLAYLVDEAVIGLGVFDLLFDELDLVADLEVFGGNISLSYSGPIPSNEKQPKKRKRGRAQKEEEEEDEEEEDATPINVRAKAEGVLLNRLHDLRRKLTVPIKGDLEFDLSMESETGRFADAQGGFGFSLKEVVLSKANFEAQTSFGRMKVPPLKIDSIETKINIEKGVGKIEEFEFKSKHLDVKVEGTITFSDPPATSRIDIYVAFQLADAYVNQSESFKFIVSNLENVSRDFKKAKRDDGYYGFRYLGPIGKGRFTPLRTPPSEKKERKRKKRSSKSRRKKPGVKPEKPIRPGAVPGRSLLTGQREIAPGPRPRPGSDLEQDMPEIETPPAMQRRGLQESEPEEEVAEVEEEVESEEEEGEVESEEEGSGEGQEEGAEGQEEEGSGEGEDTEGESGQDEEDE